MLERSWSLVNETSVAPRSSAETRSMQRPFQSNVKDKGFSMRKEKVR